MTRNDPSSERTVGLVRSTAATAARARALVLAVVVAVAACGGDEPASPRSPDPTQVAFPDAPLLVQGRPILPACGEETIGVGVSGDPAARDCLWAAYEAQRPAELVTHMTSIEGDPVTYVYRVLPGGSVEVFVDQTQDLYSTGGWLRLACPGLSRLEDGVLALGLGEGCAETRIG